MAHARRRQMQHPDVGLLGAIVGMVVPRDVAQMAGRDAQDAVGRALVGEGRTQPVENLGRRQVEAPPAGALLLGEGDQRMALPLRLAQADMVKALAQAERREDHRLRLECHEQAVEGQAGERQGIDAPARHTRHLLQRLGALHRDQPGDGTGLFSRDLVVVDDVQGVARLLHVQAGEGAPGAAHRIEGLAGFLAQPAHAVDCVDHGTLGIDLARGHQAQRSDRQRARLTQPAVGQRHQFEAATAQIAHHAIGVGHAADHAEAGKARFVTAAHDVGLDARPARQLAHEVGTVCGISNSGRGQQVERRHFHVLRQHRETVDVGQRHLDSRRIEPTCGVQPARQSAQHLLVEHR